MRSPTDFKQGITIQPNPEMTRAKHMAELEKNLTTMYDSLEGLDEFGYDNIPDVHAIKKKLLLYSNIYNTLGELAGECERMAIWCDAKKKMAYEDFMIENEDKPGTLKMKEIKANKAGHKYRINRDHFKGLAELWRNRSESTKEAINILKWMIRDFHEANKGN